MKTTRIFFTAAAFAISSLVAFSASNNLQEGSIYPGAFASISSKAYFEIPFTLVYDHFMVVVATINGERLNLVLDEGALETTLDWKKAQHLGLGRTASFSIGEQTFNETPSFAEFDAVRNSGLIIDGVVGSSIFDNYDVEYDMVKGVIICRPF